MSDDQALAVERGRNPKPMPMVVRRDGAVILPPFDIGTLAGILEDDATRLPGAALHAEMEPLPKLGIGIGTDVKTNVVTRIRVDDFDRAGVKGTADFDHGGIRGFGTETPSPVNGADSID